MADKNWTREQLSAIDTKDCNLLVAAAAGAGKTAVLVERIIRRITDTKNPVDIDKLLVVTFTNAAASEMRERIGDAIAKALDKNPDSKVLQTQLTLLGKSSITTIHSFCLEVIRNNFHLIDLDPNFRIGDETENVILKQESMDEIFDEMYESGNMEFLQLIESYGGSRDDTGLQEIVENLHRFAISSPWPEEWLNSAAEDFNAGEDFDFGTSKWGESLLKSVMVEMEGMADNMAKAIEIIKNAEGLENYLPIFEGEYTETRNAANMEEASWDSIKESMENVTFGKLKPVRNVDKDIKDCVQKIRKDVKDRFEALIENVFALDNASIKDEVKRLYPVMKSLSKLVIDFGSRYSDKKREKGLIDFNDIEHFCLGILTKREEDGKISPSDVALQYREKFQEVLVDEYQDSNFVQEVILSMVSKKDEEVPNMFMVGDVKQSIYRFRQARPELFLEKYGAYPDSEGDRCRRILLYKNFRSRQEVIEGINYIFKNIMSKNIGDIEYTDTEKLNLGASFEALSCEGAAGGPVEIHIIDKKANEEAHASQSESGEDASAVEEEDVDNIQLEARMAAKRIRELIDSENPFMVFGKDVKEYRRVEYKDIVILLRATSSWAPVFLEEFGRYGIPTYADTGTGYFETTEIKTMLSLLQVIDNPMQDIPLLGVLRSPVASFTPEELIEIRMECTEGNFHEAMEETASKDESSLSLKVRNFLERLKVWQEKAVYMPVNELLWYLYTDTGYYGYAGSIAGGFQRQANLRLLFERAKAYEDTSFKGLFNFINFINRLKRSSGDMGDAKTLGENENVVKIMSIHKSKGLEFPVVFVCGMGKNFNTMDLRGTILYHHQLGFGPEYVDYIRRISYSSAVKEALKSKIRLENLSEEMRVLYVALTRAQEKLIITGSVSDLRKAASRWIGSSGKGRIPEYEVLKARCFLDWVGPSIVTHRDCALLRELGGSSDEIVHDMEGDNSRWQVRLWAREDILDGEGTQEQEDDIAEKLNDINLEASTEFSEEIDRRLRFQYAFSESPGLPAKLSVSELKRLMNADIEEDAMPLDNALKIEEKLPEEPAKDEVAAGVFSSSILKKPQFLEKKSSLTAAEKGTITHLCMQHLDLTRVGTIKDIKAQIEDMVERELLTRNQADSIYIKRLHSFYKSTLGQRMLKSERVMREVPFYIEVGSTEVYKNLPKDYDEEMIMLQGVIDCCFLEEGGWVLLDYKTDYVSEDNMDEIKDRYRVQIDCYANALQKITGRAVKNKYIYLFYSGDILEY